MTGRVVFLTYVYPPDESPRAVQIGRLVHHSALEDLHVVCATEGAAGEHVYRVPWSRRSRTWRQLRWRTIRSRLLLPDAFRPWAEDAARAAHGLDPRVLVTFGQPMSDHLAGLRLKRQTGVRWIAHFSDPWVDNPFRAGGAVSLGLNRRLEAQVVHGADRLVFTSPQTVDLVMAKYPAGLRAKAQVIPHAFDPAGYPEVAPRVDGQPVMVRHLGAFYGARSPAPLLRALAALARRDPALLDGVHVELWGPAETPVESLPEYQALPAGLVAVRGNAPYAESLELMRTADLLVVADAPAERSVFLPSKLVDYVGARRPLLALTPPGAAADVVARSGGWVAAPDRPTDAAHALAAALATARSNGRQDWGTPAVASAFQPEVIARAMDVLIAETASGG